MTNHANEGKKVNAMNSESRKRFEDWHDCLFDVLAAHAAKSEFGYPRDHEIQARYQVWQAREKEVADLKCEIEYWKSTFNFVNLKKVSAYSALQKLADKNFDWSSDCGDQFSYDDWVLNTALCALSCTLSANCPSQEEIDDAHCELIVAIEALEEIAQGRHLNPGFIAKQALDTIARASGRQESVA